MTTQFYAYIHARPDGTPFYVGKGSGLRSHWFRFRSAYHQNIVAKCGGPDKVIVSRYPVSSEEFAFELEKGLIKTLRRMGHELCNLTDGGEGIAGYKHDPEWVKRHAEMLRGRKHTPETLAKRAATMKVVLATTEYKQRMSAAQTGRTWSAETRAKYKLYRPTAETIEKNRLVNTGKTWTAEMRAKRELYSPTAETRAKMSAARVGKKQSKETILKRAAKNTGQKRAPEVREADRVRALNREALKRITQGDEA